MKGFEQWLIQYIGSGAHFIVPVYQRNYNWRLEQCRQLFDDLVSVARKGHQSHFFGSIVSVSDPGGKMLDYLIIDGQQRLTTVSLLMLAMYRLLTEGKIQSEQQNLAPMLLKKYLIDEFESEQEKIKLKPIKDDQKVFRTLFDADETPAAESNLTINYEYFRSRILGGEISADELFAAISKLQIINILLGHDDDPQLIFESLNSTGMALEEGDKIRNYILMGLSLHDQEVFYTKYWNEIEKNTGFEVSAFIRDYLSIMQKATPNIKSVYGSFKEYRKDTEKREMDTEAVLKEMLSYSKRYRKLIQPNVTSSGSTDLDWCIYRLNRLKTTVTRPFFLEVLKFHEEGKLSGEELLRVFRQVESYLFRRTLCDLPTNALNKIFLFLHRDIVNLGGDEEGYCEKMVYVLNSKKESGRFPTDEEFRAAISQKNIYLMRGENKKYLFERLENGNLKDGSIGVWNKLDCGALTIEHIMPQKLTPGWMEDLGEDYERIYDQWLHRLANLTLTGYNSEYQNSRFTDKKTIEGGFDQGGLHINWWIKKQDQWTEIEMEQRDAMLQDEAVKLWPRPETEYTPPQRQLDRVTLDEDEILTGKNISRYSFLGVEQSVASWTDLYQQVLRQLHEGDKSILTHLAVSKNPDEDLSLHFFASPNETHSCRRIDNNVYVWTGTSTQSKVNMLKKVLPLFHVEMDQLVFYLEDTETDAEGEEQRYAIRRKYWQYAIAQIREATGTFTYGGNTQSNSIAGITAIPRVQPLCIANFDAAIVKLYIDLADKKKNKELFDRLLAHREEIETAYGKPLTWSRSEDTRSSSIMDKLADVSVGNEADWPRMARFHAEQMTKLLNAVNPYLNEAKP